MSLGGEFKREVGVVTYLSPFHYNEVDIIDIAIGNLVSVEFNFLRIRDFISRRKNSHHGFQAYRLDFWHIHPDDHLEYSIQDQRCAESLEIALGFPVRFGLVSSCKGHIYHRMAQFCEDDSTWKEISKHFLTHDVEDILILASRE